MWQELLRLKGLREQQARQLLLRRRSEQAAAHAAREAASVRLASHRAAATREEQGLYDALLARLVRLREIEDVQLRIALLRQLEDELARAERQAIQAQTEADGRVQQALAEHRAADRRREKFVQLLSLHLDELAREAERGEDLELEEVAALRRDRDDWDRVCGESTT